MWIVSKYQHHMYHFRLAFVCFWLMFGLIAYTSPTPYPISWRTLPLLLLSRGSPSASTIMWVKATGLPMNRLKSCNKDCSNVCTTESLGKYWNMENTDLRSYFSLYHIIAINPSVSVLFWSVVWIEWQISACCYDNSWICFMNYSMYSSITLKVTGI